MLTSFRIISSESVCSARCRWWRWQWRWWQCQWWWWRCQWWWWQSQWWWWRWSGQWVVQTVRRTGASLSLKIRYGRRRCNSHHHHHHHHHHHRQYQWYHCHQQGWHIATDYLNFSRKDMSDPFPLWRIGVNFSWNYFRVGPCWNVQVTRKIFSHFFSLSNLPVLKFHCYFFVKLNLIKIRYNVNSTDVRYYDYFEAIVESWCNIGLHAERHVLIRPL